MELAIRLLGPLEVVGAGRVVTIRGAKERTLLVLLALQVGRVVPTHRLVDDLWEGEPPESGTVSLRVLVSRVRKALAEAGAGEIIVTQPPGYLLATDVQVDAVRFDELARRGRAELAEGRYELASATLTEALGLWRGETLADASGDSVRGEEARLTEARLTSLESRFDADLACGRHAELIAELQHATSAYPLREGFWAQRLVALYRSGRQAEALRCYQELRELMVDQLGIDPSPPLRRLEAAILAQDDAVLLSRPAHVDGALASAAPSPVALPARLEIVPRVGIIGREAELAGLSAAYKLATAGEGPKLVLLAGEAGMGKSTLMAELARRTHRDGAFVLHGRSDVDLSIPYQSFLEALRTYLANVPDELLHRHSARALGELSRFLPELSGRRPDLPPPTVSDADAERWLFFGAVATVLAEAGSSQPVVVLLDDLHAADRPTLQLLRHLTRADLSRTLIVCAYRPDEMAARASVNETLASFRDEPAVARITVSGLADVDVAAFLDAYAGRQLGSEGSELAHILRRDTVGNPFFLAELLRHLVEIGALVQNSEGGWVATVDLSSVGLPDTVREVISTRVGRLGSDARQVLSVAAVIGEEFDLELLERLSDVDEDGLLDLLESAARASVVSEVPGEPGRYRFVHALSQHSLYGDLSATRKARLHLRVADALEQLCGDDPGSRVGELARHYLSGTRPTDARKAARYARSAGERAMLTLAPDEAVRWFAEALDVVEPGGVEHAQLLARLGDAQRQAGDPGYRATLLDAAREATRLGDTGTVVSAALANSRGWQSAAGQLDDERIAVLGTALDALGAVDDPRRAELLSLLALEQIFDSDFSGRRQQADLALELARRAGDPATLLRVLNRRYQAIWIADTFEERGASTAEAMVIAAASSDPVARYWAASWRAMWGYEAGDLELYATCGAMLVDIAEEVGQPILRWTASIHRCTMALLEGEAERAELVATETLQLGNDTGQPDALTMYGAQLIVIRWFQGRSHELVPLVASIADANPLIPAYRAALAMLTADGGLDEQARALLSAEKAGRFVYPDDFVLLSGLVAWAETAVLMADADAAALLRERLVGRSHLVAITGASVLGSVAHFEGGLAAILGRHNEADEHFAHALSVHEAMGAPFLIARTELEWARMLLATDRHEDRGRGLALLAAARELAGRYGCAAVSRRAAALS